MVIDRINFLRLKLCHVMKRELIKLMKSIVDRFPKLAMTYRYMRDSWQIYEEPEMTPLGFKFIGNRSMQEGKFEPEETEIVGYRGKIVAA